MRVRTCAAHGRKHIRSKFEDINSASYMRYIKVLCVCGGPYIRAKLVAMVNSNRIVYNTLYWNVFFGL